MKRFLSVLLSLTMLLMLVPASALPVFAVEEYTQGVYTYTVTDGEATITGYNGAGGDVVTPTTLGGYPVVEIGDRAFRDNAYITSVTIPDGVRKIGEEAFRYCDNLTSVTMTDSVTTLGGWAFCNDGSLTSATLSDNITKLDIGVFGCCYALVDVNIPNSATRLNEEAFFGCKSLTNVVIPEAVTWIGLYTFDDCISLTSITIPVSVQFIVYSFYNCPALKDVYYGGTEADRDAMELVCNATGDALISATWHYSDGTVSDGLPHKGLLYEISNGEVTITGYTDDVPEHLVIPATIEGYPVKAIGNGAFFGVGEDYHIISIVVPEGVETIGNRAFGSDMSDTLVSVELPDTVTSIGEYAFFNSSVREVNIPKGITTIPKGAFFGSGITSITIPDSVTTIEMDAFMMCDLTSVVIPDSVTTIGDFAFQYCSQLTSVVLSQNLDSVGWYAFSDCGKLTSVVIPDGVKTIDGGAFCDAALTSVTLPDSVTTIDEYAFVACENLTAVTLPKNIEIIEPNAFVGCSSLRDVYYAGSAEDRANIYVGESNDPLLSATWHYNYVEPAELFYPIVNHSVMDTAQGTGLAFRFTLAVKGMNVVWGNVATYANATVNYLGTDCKLLGMGAVLTNRADVNLVLENVNDQNVLDIPAVYLTHLWQESCAFSVRIKDIPANQMERMIYARPYYIVEVNGEAVTVYGDIDAASCQSVSNSIA